MEAPDVQLAAAWDFTPEEEMLDGYCSRVYADGTRVLKIPFQGEEMTSGRVASLLFAEAGVSPRVFRDDPKTGALLMERVLPGTKMSDVTISEPESLAVWVDFIRRFPKTVVAGLTPLQDYVSKTDPLAQQLLSTTNETCLLHGDLHHDNILIGPQGWLTIDAKGLLGDPAYEAAAFIRNPLNQVGDWPHLDQILRNRILVIAEATGWPRDRVWGWSLVSARDEAWPDDHPWAKVRFALESLAGEFARP